MDEREFIREIMDDGTREHIEELMPREMGELTEFHEMAYKLAGKVYRRTQKIKKHMMTCEACLNRQMKLGLLMPLEEYYKGPEGLKQGVRAKFLNETN